MAREAKTRPCGCRRFCPGAFIPYLLHLVLAEELPAEPLHRVAERSFQPAVDFLLRRRFQSLFEFRFRRLADHRAQYQHQARYAVLTLLSFDAFEFAETRFQDLRARHETFARGLRL